MIVVGPLPFCNKDEWGVVAVILDNNCQVSDGISAEYFKGFVSFPKSQLCEVVCLYWNVIPHLVQIPSLVNRVQQCRPAWFFILNPKTSETWGMCSGQCWQCCTEKCTKLTWMKRCLLSMKLAAKSRFFNKVFYFLLKFLQIKRQWAEPGSWQWSHVTRLQAHHNRLLSATMRVVSSCENPVECWVHRLLCSRF